ncbi:MAG: tetratricopeptide repeat protein [Thermodesulfovibrionales bacterium]
MKTLSLKKRCEGMLFVVICFSLLLYASSVMSQSAEDIYNLAVKAYKSGDFKSASQYFEEYVKLRPEPQAYYLLGYSYYKLKLFDKAEGAFNEAYLIDPELVPPKLDKVEQ